MTWRTVGKVSNREVLLGVSASKCNACGRRQGAGGHGEDLYMHTYIYIYI